MLKGTSICCIVSMFLVLGGVAVLIAWSVDKPKNPSFFINQAAIANYKFTPDNRLNATFTLVIVSHNRDAKYTVNYNNIMVAIFHDTYSLANQPNIGPFTQHHGDLLTIMAQPTARNLTVLDADVATGLRNGTKLGQLKVEVRIRAYVRFEVKRWKHKGYTLGIVCAPLVIDLASGKSLEGTNCNVDRF